MTSLSQIRIRPCAVCKKDCTHYALKCSECGQDTYLRPIDYYFGGKKPKPQLTETQRLEADRARRRKYALRASRKSRVVMVEL